MLPSPSCSHHLSSSCKTEILCVSPPPDPLHVPTRAQPLLPSKHSPEVFAVKPQVTLHSLPTPVLDRSAWEIPPPARPSSPPPDTGRAPERLPLENAQAELWSQPRQGPSSQGHTSAFRALTTLRGDSSRISLTACAVLLLRPGPEIASYL